MSYYGNIKLGDVIDIKFTTVNSIGIPTSLTSGSIAAYPGNSVTEVTSGITLSTDFDSLSGLNNVNVVATSGNGYTDITNYSLVVMSGTVDGNPIAGYVVGSFSIGARISNLSDATETQIDDIKSDVTAILADTDSLDTTKITSVRAGNLDNISFAASLPGTPTNGTFGDALKKVSVGVPLSPPGVLGGLATFSNVLGAAIIGSIDDVSPSSSGFNGNSSLESSNDSRYLSQFLVFTEGASLAGEARRINGYTASTRSLAFSTPFSATPGNGDPFLIIGRAI